MKWPRRRHNKKREKEDDVKGNVQCYHRNTFGVTLKKKQTVTSPTVSFFSIFTRAPCEKHTTQQIKLLNEIMKVRIRLNQLWSEATKSKRIWSHPAVNHNTVSQCLLSWLSQRLFVCLYVNASFIIHHNPLCNPSCRLNLCVWQKSSGEAHGAVTQSEYDSSGSMVHAAIVWASVDGHQSWWESEWVKNNF